MQVKSRYTNTEITKDNYFSITCKMGTNYDPLTNKWATDSDSIPAKVFMVLCPILDLILRNGFSSVLDINYS